MRAPTVDHSRPEPPTTGARRRRSPLLLLAALTVAAASTGVAIALAARTVPASPASDRVVQVATPPTTLPARDLAPTPTTTPRPVLADGSYDGFVRSVNVDRRTIVVDLVQVLEGEAAFKAAKEDGKYAEKVGPGTWLPEWYVRNQNPLLRTLPVVPDVRIQFHGACEGPAPGRPALTELAKRRDAFKGWYYYDFTVAGGLVQTIQERQVQPAC